MLCAICDRSSQVTSLCASCRADPANDGWSEEWRGVLFAPTEKLDRIRVADDGPQEPRALSHSARLEDEALRLITFGEVEVYRYMDKRGHFRGYRERRKFLTLRQIADRVGRSHVWVFRKRKRLLG